MQESTSNKRVRALVAGTRFGATWAMAIHAAGREMELAGLLGRGSPASRQLERDLRVPLWTSVDDVPQVDVACVAIGGRAGIEIAERLLARKIPVIFEFPADSRQTAHLLEVAASHETPFRVHVHCAELAPVAAFVEMHARLSKLAPSRWVEICSPPRLIYAAAALAVRMFGSSAPKLLGAYTPAADLVSGYASVIDMLFGAMPVRFTLWGVVDTSDRGMDVNMVLSARGEFPFGRLTLADYMGPLSVGLPGVASIDLLQAVSSATTVQNLPGLELGSVTRTWFASQGMFEVLEARSASQTRAVLDVAKGATVDAYSPDKMMATARLWEMLVRSTVIREVDLSKSAP